MTGTPFALTLKHGGYGSTVVVDGHDVSDKVADLVVRAGGREMVTLDLSLVGEATIEGEAIVNVHSEATDHAALADFVRSLDAGQISNLVAQRSGMGTSTAGLYLDVIAQMIEADG